MKTLYLLMVMFLILPAPSLWAESLRVRNIILTGNEAFSDPQIRSLMRTQVGRDYDEEVLHQDFDRMITFYQEQGYRFARIDEGRFFIKKFAEGVYLRIHIDEGIIGKITVKGNRRTKDYVIIRELLFQVGSTYTWEDELESERILRRKPYLGSAEILATRDPETMEVWIEVEVTDLWTFIPALDLPAFSQNNSSFLVELSDSNLFGSGDSANLRYQLIREEGEEPRHLVSSQYMISRLFDSHWDFDGTYTQKRIGNSWRVKLQRPQYSLQTRWSADFMASESVDEKPWYEQGEKTDVFERSMQTSSGRVTRYFGDRHQQTQVSFWTISQRMNFKRIEQFAQSAANFQDRNVRLIGVSLGHKQVDFLRTRFLNQLGRVEDVGVGYEYGVSIGYASPFYGSDRIETNLNLFFDLSQAYDDRLFLNADTNFSTAVVKQQLEDSVFSGSFRVIRKDLFHQTLAAQLSTVMGFGLNGGSQVILGGDNGLRGYDARQFSGEKVLQLNLESRVVWWEHPLIVVGSAIFADVGYIWSGEALNLRAPKRSVGFGLRLSIPKLSGSRVYRIDFAYPLDSPEKLSFKPVITYGIRQVF